MAEQPLVTKQRGKAEVWQAVVAALEYRETGAKRILNREPEKIIGLSSSS